MSDLDQPEIAARAAQSAIAPDFDLLKVRAVRRRRTAVVSAGLAVAAVAAGVVTLVGVSVDRAGPVPPVSTPTDVTPPTTSKPLARTHPWPANGPCPRTSLRDLPEGSGCATVTHGDFDGDGGTDSLIVYAYPLTATRHAAAWHIRLVPAAGSVVDQRLPKPDPSGVENIGVVGHVDVNRDGRDDAFVLLAGGASNDFLTIFMWDDGRLVRASNPVGGPLEVDFGATVLDGAGLGCRTVSGRPEFLTTGFSYSAHGRVWEWNETVYAWQGSQLVDLRRRHGVTSGDRTSSYARFDCFGLHLASTARPRVVH